MTLPPAYLPAARIQPTPTVDTPFSGREWLPIRAPANEPDPTDYVEITPKSDPDTIEPELNK